MSIPFSERITVTILQFSEGSGYSISKTREMKRSGELETITNRRRRLVVRKNESCVCCGTRWNYDREAHRTRHPPVKSERHPGR